MTEDQDLPKYRQRNFMAKEISLYHAARIATRLTQRYGNSDDPISPISDVASVRRTPPVRDTIARDDDFNDI